MSSALLIIERKEQILSLLYQDNRLVQVKVHDGKGEGESSSLPLGAIYIGKVKNVVPTIDAAFVEVCKGSMGFLPMKNAKNPIIVNRKYDGRILAGDEILVQIEKEGIKTKDPGLTCNLSFTGKYCVLTTGKQNLGFSTKLDNKTKLLWKQKLEEWKIEDTLLEEKVGMVVRTNVAVLTEHNLNIQNNNLKIENVNHEYRKMSKNAIISENRDVQDAECFFVQGVVPILF